MALWRDEVSWNSDAAQGRDETFDVKQSRGGVDMTYFVKRVRDGKTVGPYPTAIVATVEKQFIAERNVKDKFVVCMLVEIKDATW
jgi:hypothetical protein